MEEQHKRRGNRIELMMKIQVIGSDTAGQQFMDDAHTVVISPYGAMIVLGRGLTPEDEIIVRCMTTKKEAADCMDDRRPFASLIHMRRHGQRRRGDGFARVEFGIEQALTSQP